MEWPGIRSEPVAYIMPKTRPRRGICRGCSTVLEEVGGDVDEADLWMERSSGEDLQWNKADKIDVMFSKTN